MCLWSSEECFDLCGREERCEREQGVRRRVGYDVLVRVQCCWVVCDLVYDRLVDRWEECFDGWVEDGCERFCVGDCEFDCVLLLECLDKNPELIELKLLL